MGLFSGSETETIAIRVSKTLLKKIDLSAAYENTSRGEFLAKLIEANISNVNQCTEVTPVPSNRIA